MSQLIEMLKILFSAIKNPTWKTNISLNNKGQDFVMIGSRSLENEAQDFQVYDIKIHCGWCHKWCFGSRSRLMIAFLVLGLSQGCTVGQHHGTIIVNDFSTAQGTRNNQCDQHLDLQPASFICSKLGRGTYVLSQITTKC